MSAALARIVEDVVGAAEADPDGAPAIYANAAGEFRAFAQQRQHARLARALHAYATEFEVRARHHVQHEGRATVDDFEEIEHEQAQAHAEQGHLDDLEIRARRIELHERKAGRARQRTAIVPESVIDETRLGRQITVNYTPTLAQANNKVIPQENVVYWRGDKAETRPLTIDIDILETNGDKTDGARTYVDAASAGALGATLFVGSTDGFAPSGTFDINGVHASYTGKTLNSLTGISTDSVLVTVAAGDAVTQDPQPASARPFALIQFGSDGFIAPPFYVDVGAGVRLTGEGNYCSVIVGMAAPAGGFLSATYTLGGRLSFFGAPSVAPPFFTTYIDALASGDTTDPIPLPVRGKFILPPQESDPAGSMEIGFLDSTGTERYVLPIPIGSAIAPIPITGDIRSITIKNTGANTADFRIPWQLSV